MSSLQVLRWSTSLVVLFVGSILGGFWDPNRHIYCENYFFNPNYHRWECPEPTPKTTTPKPPVEKSSNKTTSYIFSIFLLALFVVFVVAISKCLKCWMKTLQQPQQVEMSRSQPTNPSAPPILTLDPLPSSSSTMDILKEPVRTPPPEYQAPPPYNDYFFKTKG